jgi:hypothetical protein
MIPPEAVDTPETAAGGLQQDGRTAMVLLVLVKRGEPVLRVQI